jgi:hypothetical protein
MVFERVSSDGDYLSSSGGKDLSCFLLSTWSGCRKELGYWVHLKLAQPDLPE